MEEVGPTKSKRSRRLTLGSGTVELWRSSVEAWEHRLAPRARFGPWLFGADLAHRRRLTTSALAHGFADLCADSGMPGLMLRRLRQSVATLLVGQGDLLDAQARLGHRDASTMLRNYVHALPLGDAAAAGAIDAALRPRPTAGGSGQATQAP